MNGAGRQSDRIAWAAFILLLGLASWFAGSAYQRATQAARRVQVAEQNWRALGLADPMPTAEGAAHWRERRESLEKQLAHARRALGEGREKSTTPVPTQRAEAFFAIAQFVERQRALAREAGVGLPEGYALGFSAYANSGPPDEELAIVHRQVQVVDALLELLWRSGARELTRVQRELPARKLTDATPRSGTSRAEGRPEDFLPGAAERSLARDGIVDMLELRLGFIGKTATLRRYLNELPALPLPLVVRAVEVEPLGANGAARGGIRTLADLFGEELEPVEGAAGDDGVVPIIASNESEFLVTVAYLDFSPLENGEVEP